MVRGLCYPWKQPLFYAFDEAMTMQTIELVVTTLGAIGLKVVAAVSDMAPANESMWKAAGVSESRPWITNPADPNR